MPRKSLAHRARVPNLQNAYLRITAREEEEEETPESNASDHSQDSRIDTAVMTWDSETAKLLDMVGALRGSAVVEDELESEDESDDEEVGTPEIHEPSALKQFLAMLQRAHDIALEVEREWGRRNNRPKRYAGNSERTKRRHQQTARALAAKGFPSVKDWLIVRKNTNDATEISPLGSSDTDDPEPLTDSEADVNPLETPLETPLRSVSTQPDVQESEESEDEMWSEVAIWTCVDRENEAIPTPEEAEKLRCQAVVHKMLEDLRNGKRPEDNTEETDIDRVLNQMNYKNFPLLRRALATLNMKAKDKRVDVVFRSRVTAMAGALALYLDAEVSYTWKQSSLVVAKLQGHGASYARVIRRWIHQFLNSGKLPQHGYRGQKSTILEDEDIALEIQLKLAERAKDRYIRALDVVEIVATEQVQEQLEAAGIQHRQISERTARQWLKRFQWRYSQKKKGMYIDGHEWDDVVAYRQQFVSRFFKDYAPRMFTWDHEGNMTRPANGFAIPNNRPFRLILVTHDESTFYANDERKSRWVHQDQKAVTERKGDGMSIMISDFLTSEWGHLASEDGRE
jgi:hypothetical protein